MKNFLFFLLAAAPLFAIQDPGEFATPHTPVWIAVENLSEARAKFGGINLVAFHDGHDFILLPKDCVANYQRGASYGSVSEITAPDSIRDHALVLADIKSFAAKHPDDVLLVPVANRDSASPNKLTILIDEDGIPFEQTR